MMKDSALVSNYWLNNLPVSHADYLSYTSITLGRHPSAFLIYMDKIRFIKQVPDHIQKKEYAVLTWLARLQLETQTLSATPPVKIPPPTELQIPLPDVVDSRSDLLITSKLDGIPLNKTNLLAKIAMLCKVMVYIHRLVEVTHLPNMIVQALDHQLPININDVSLRFQSQFNQAHININQNLSILGFIHGDLSSGNILVTDSTIGLVDWEYAAIRDCRWDLATLAVEFKLDVEEFDTFCGVYMQQRGIVDKSFTSVAKSWAVVYANTCLTWAKQHNQDTDRYIQFLEQLES